MHTGLAVIGDTQHLPGYSLLLTDALDAHQAYAALDIPRLAEPS
jgi:hypothetical protein